MNLDVTQYPCLRMPTVAPEDMTEEDKIKLAAIALVQQTFLMNQDDMTTVPTNDEMEERLARATIVVRESREAAAEAAARADETNRLLFMPLDRPEVSEPLWVSDDATMTPMEDPVRAVGDDSGCSIWCGNIANNVSSSFFINEGSSFHKI